MEALNHFLPTKTSNFDPVRLTTQLAQLVPRKTGRGKGGRVMKEREQTMVWKVVYYSGVRKFEVPETPCNSLP